MSLIHEALKKVEGSRATANGGGTSAYAPEAINAAPNAWSRRLPVLVAIVALMASAAVVFIYLDRPEAITAPVTSPAVKVQTQAPIAQDAAKPASSPQKAAPAGKVAQKNAASLNEEGVFSYKTGRYAEAAARLKAAVEAEPDNAVYRNNYALSLMRSGRLDEAESELRRAIELLPEYPEALSNYGTLLASREEHASALSYFDRAVKADHAYAEAHVNMAVSLEVMGRTRDAVAAYEAFLELNEDAELELKVRKKVARLRSALIIEERGR